MPRTRRLPARTTTPPPSPPRVLKPHPLAWEAALRLAGGDASRLLVDASDSVLVMNRSRL